MAQGYAALTALHGPRAEEDHHLLDQLDAGLGPALAGLELLGLTPAQSHPFRTDPAQSRPFGLTPLSPTLSD